MIGACHEMKFSELRRDQTLYFEYFNSGSKPENKKIFTFVCVSNIVWKSIQVWCWLSNLMLDEADEVWIVTKWLHVANNYISLSDIIRIKPTCHSTNINLEFEEELRASNKVLQWSLINCFNHSEAILRAWDSQSRSWSMASKLIWSGGWEKLHKNVIQLNYRLIVCIILINLYLIWTSQSRPYKESGDQYWKFWWRVFCDSKSKIKSVSWRNALRLPQNISRKINFLVVNINCAYVKGNPTL